jgi:hypothetical protein
MPPDITRASFGGAPFPPEVIAFLMDAALTGAPLVNSLKRQPTSRQSVAFPIAGPTGSDWVAEGAPIPSVDLNDSLVVGTVVKLAGILEVSNESVDDADFDLAGQLGQSMARAFGPQLDTGALYGAGGVQPEGLWAKAAAGPEGDTYREAIIRAWGDLIDAGAPPDSITVFSKGSDVSAEWSETALGSGVPLHGDQQTDTPLFIGPGIKVVPTPTMVAGNILAVDTSSTYYIVRKDTTIEGSSHYAWATDGWSIRVKARVGIGCPVPAKSLRKVTVAAVGG